MAPEEARIDDGDELVIEVDGDGVHLDTLDAPGVLNLAVAYLELLRRCAADRDDTIEFRGLRAFEKCGSLGTHPSDPELARRAVVDAFNLLASWERPARGLKLAVDNVRAARAALPSNYRALVKMGGVERLIAAEAMSVLDQAPYVSTTLRAHVQRVGGIKPRATFISNSERVRFHLDLRDAEQATSLGTYLYKVVDIVALVVRDASGNIEGGTLREFHPVADGSAGDAWGEWFRESGVRSLDELTENTNGGSRRGDG
jgi:hypothetical protein